MFHSSATDRKATAMTTTTAALVSTLMMWAGPDYLWNNGPRPGHKPTSSAKVGLMAYLMRVTGGECAWCGVALQTTDPNAPDAANLCHIVSRGPERRGWLAGNIAIGCKRDNDMHKAHGPVAPLPTVHGVPTVWPSVPVLTRMGKAIKASR